MATKWEYLTTLLKADINEKGVAEGLRKLYPNWKEPPKFHIKTLEPQLDDLGNQGWELVSIEPILIVGSNRDLGVRYSYPQYDWYRYYFCTFKREKNPS